MMIHNNITTWNTTCESMNSGRKYLSSPQSNVLIAFNTVIMMLSLFANLSVVYSITATNQIRIVSMRLILYLSISDCCLAVIFQPLFVVMLTVYSDSSNCTFEYTLQFIHISVAHIPAYIIFVITFERLFRMRNLKRVAVVLPYWKVHLAVAIAIFVALLHGIFYVIGTRLHVFAKVSLVAIIIDIFLLLVVFLAYFMMIFIVKKQKSEVARRQVLNNVDQLITRLATKILITVACCYFPYVTLTFLRSIFIDKTTGETRKWLHFALLLSYILTFTNSFANAIIFLNLNKKAREKLICRSTLTLHSISGRIRSANTTETEWYDDVVLLLQISMGGGGGGGGRGTAIPPSRQNVGSIPNPAQIFLSHPASRSKILNPNLASNIEYDTISHSQTLLFSFNTLNTVLPWTVSNYINNLGDFNSYKHGSNNETL